MVSCDKSQRCIVPHSEEQNKQDNSQNTGGGDGGASFSQVLTTVRLLVRSVGKFRTGRIIYHLQKIPIMENVFHFFTQSASVAPRNWCGESEERVNGTRRSIRNVPTGKTGLPFQTIRIFREFSSWMNPKNVFHLHSNRNFRNFLANGKQPWCHLISIGRRN